MFVSVRSEGPPGPAMPAYLAGSGGIDYSYPLINDSAVGLDFIEHVSLLQ